MSSSKFWLKCTGLKVLFFSGYELLAKSHIYHSLPLNVAFGHVGFDTLQLYLCIYPPRPLLFQDRQLTPFTKPLTIQ